MLSGGLMLNLAPAWGDSSLPIASTVQPSPIAQPLISPDVPEDNPTSTATSTLINAPATLELTSAPSFALADAAIDLELSPAVVNGSPVLQRWLQGVPNVLSDIANAPSFRTRVRLSYDGFPSTNQAAGWNVGVEDIFVGRTGLTVSGDYQAAFDSAVQRDAWGAELRYYVRPLGSYVNLAPVVGYRRLTTNLYSTEGLNLGLRLLLVPSRGGGADVALTQTWVAPGTDREVGVTTLAAGYALTHNLRLFTEIQQQNARQRQDSRVGLGLEWML